MARRLHPIKERPLYIYTPKPKLIPLFTFKETLLFFLLFPSLVVIAIIRFFLITRRKDEWDKD